MARLPPPVTRITSSMPEATASSTPYWMVGLSTSGSISLGWALVTGRKRVPSPAAGNTALRTGGTPLSDKVSGGRIRECPAGDRGIARPGGRRNPLDQPRRAGGEPPDPRGGAADGGGPPPRGAAP